MGSDHARIAHFLILIVIVPLILLSALLGNMSVALGVLAFDLRCHAIGKLFLALRELVDIIHRIVEVFTIRAVLSLKLVVMQSVEIACSFKVVQRYLWASVVGPWGATGQPSGLSFLQLSHIRRVTGTQCIRI